MSTPAALAFALEGTWHIEFGDLPVPPCTVTIENRALSGDGPDVRVSGDFRINETSVTAFLRVRWNAGNASHEVLLQGRGPYHPTELTLLMDHIEQPGRVSVTLRRV